MSQDIAKIQRAYEKWITKGAPQELLDVLSPLPTMNKNISLQIYKNNYISSLLKSMTDTYSACEKLLENETFTRLILDYISQTPSPHPLLSSYGETFPTFLSHSVIHREIPFLSELARYEWTLKKVILGTFPSHEKGINFSSSHPVSEIWSAITHSEDIFEDSSEDRSQSTSQDSSNTSQGRSQDSSQDNSDRAKISEIPEAPPMGEKHFTYLITKTNHGCKTIPFLPSLTSLY